MESRRQTNSGFRQFLCSLKLQHLFVFTLAAVLLVALVMHWALNTVGLGLNIVEGDGGEDEVRARHFDLLAVKLEDPDYLVATDLRTRLLDMLSIRSSVKNELNDLEARRTSLRKQIADNQEDLDRLKASVSRIRAELARLQLSTQQAESRYRETVEKRMIPKLSLPAKLSMSADPLRLPEFKDKQNSPCTVDTCFDFSRCSIASPHLTLDLSVLTAVGDTKQSRRAWLKRLINDPTSVLPGLAIRRSSGSESQHEPPCLRLVVADNATQSGACRGPDGVNCLLLLLDNGSWRPDESMMIVSSGFPRGTFRPGFDIAIPHLDHAESRAVVTNDDEEWEELPPAFSPARRKYLASFQGEWSKKTHGVADDDAMATFLRQQLDAMAADSVETDKFFLQWECGERLLTTGASFLPPSWNDSIGAWQVCSGDQARRRILEESTFCFVLPSQQAQVHVRLVECLRAGAVPVLLWSRDIDEGWLPLDEVIDWRRCVVRVAPARLPELHFVLRSLGDADVLAMRRQGWHVWRNYFSSPARVLRAVVGLMRHRLLLPPPPTPDVAYTPMHDPVKNPMLTFEPPRGETEEEQEMLGPAHEPPTPSVTFTRNVSQLLLDSSAIWNDWFQPHWTFSARPSDPWLLSEALFRGSGAGFRPLGGGQGGAGKEMSEALGGNLPHEQFTILILTYQREQVLLSALSRFVGLPYLNKVVVVWNDKIDDSNKELRWPDIGVPIEVVVADRNSLNNRFVPYSCIETDAVLSLDDDAYLRHDEIVFAFRVWREARDRIVGFPGRFHAWDSSALDWAYNSNYSCELSMVLTGAAFVHKYYLYQYTYWMPAVIRHKVDELLNCEDIAMNFLVSHLTRKPPIKVTSRWTFRCPGCPVILSEDESHFLERHKCMQFFTKVYGYMPLLYTQFRADSVLFKTRLPRDKQKCFKYI